MSRMDRSMFRAQLKKEHKKFVKENPAYARITLSQYSELVKLTANQIRKNHLTSLNSQVPANQAAHDDEVLGDMMMDLETESGA